MTDVTGEEHRRLARRVAATDHDHLAVGAQLCLHKRGGVVDAPALELLEVGKGRFAVVRTGGDDHAARREALDLIHHDGQLNRRALEAGYPARDGDFGAKLLRLDEAPPGEGLAGDAGGEPEVVLDLRARAGLAAWPLGIEHDDAEPFRGGVHGGGKAGRTGADDRDVDAAAVESFGAEADRVGQGADRGRAQHLACVGDGHRQLILRDAEALEHGLRVGVLHEVEVDVRLPVAEQELAQTVRLARQT
jgi:hypothetical protein